MSIGLREWRKRLGKGVYFLESAVRTWRREAGYCPSCGGKSLGRLDSKYEVFQLHRCEACGLQYRTPTTSRDQSERFYQWSYIQGEQAWMPSPEKLKSHLETGFAESGLSYEFHVALLRALGAGAGARVFDFGCSWGYGSWQFMRAGFDVTAFEISTPRREFARKRLGVRTCESMESAGAGYDVFFAAHVLEHVPSVGDVFRMAQSMLRPGGMMLMITPNGSDAFRRRDPAAWHQLWGQVHPNFLDDIFYRKQLDGVPHLLASNPYDLAVLGETWHSIRGAKNLGLEGSELLMVAQF